MSTLRERRNRHQADRVEREHDMYGMPEKGLEVIYDNIPSYSSPLMVAMGMASDAQELMEMGDVESARQMLNRQKYILNRMMDEERSIANRV